MVIRANTHAPFRIPKLLYKPMSLSYLVNFTPTCVYFIGIEDQEDINKLFGIGFFPHHHRSSVRIGWNYDMSNRNIRLYAYCYQNGVRLNKYLTSVPMGQNVNLSIQDYECYVGDQKRRGYKFLVNGVQYQVMPNIKRTKLAYLLRPYFGGNKKAPHDILIQMQKRK